jgi:multisubunit Na+/H+ antiporter MnhF subunit
MPFIKDPRGMSATGLALGVVTYLVIRRDDLSDRVGTNKTALAGTSLVLGIVALVLAETAAAEVLLAVFMASILIVWAIELMDHAGILPGAGRRIGLRYP